MNFISFQGSFFSGSYFLVEATSRRCRRILQNSHLLYSLMISLFQESKGQIEKNARFLWKTGGQTFVFGFWPKSSRNTIFGSKV